MFEDVYDILVLNNLCLKIHFVSGTILVVKIYFLILSYPADNELTVIPCQFNLWILYRSLEYVYGLSMLGHLQSKFLSNI